MPKVQIPRRRVVRSGKRRNEHETMPQNVVYTVFLFARPNSFIKSIINHRGTFSRHRARTSKKIPNGRRRFSEENRFCPPNAREIFNKFYDNVQLITASLKNVFEYLERFIRRKLRLIERATFRLRCFVHSSTCS